MRVPVGKGFRIDVERSFNVPNFPSELAPTFYHRRCDELCTPRKQQLPPRSSTITETVVMSSTTTTQQTVVPDTSSVERHGYLFGFPIAHSMSPLFHNTVYKDLGLDWNQFFLESKDMDLFLKVRQDPKFYGND